MNTTEKMCETIPTLSLAQERLEEGLEGILIEAVRLRFITGGDPFYIAVYDEKKNESGTHAFVKREGN